MSAKDVIKLDVPLVRQPRKSDDCGIAALSMILDYYHVGHNLKKLTLEIRKIDKRSPNRPSAYTYLPQFGIYLLKLGFKIEITTFNPFLFTQSDKYTKNPLRSIQKVYSNIKNKKEISDEVKVPTRFFLDFINAGGKVNVKIPDQDDIRSEIKNGKPVMAWATTNILYPNVKKARFNSHANVITGIDNKYLYVNDPLWDSRGGKKKYPFSEFLYAIYASAYGAADNAAIMKITYS